MLGESTLWNGNPRPRVSEPQGAIANGSRECAPDDKLRVLRRSTGMNMNRRITLSLIRPTGSDVPLDEALYGALLKANGGMPPFHRPRFRRPLCSPNSGLGSLSRSEHGRARLRALSKAAGTEQGFAILARHLKPPLRIGVQVAKDVAAQIAAKAGRFFPCGAIVSKVECLSSRACIFAMEDIEAINWHGSTLNRSAALVLFVPRRALMRN